jgi:phytoene synthase
VIDAAAITPRAPETTAIVACREAMARGSRSFTLASRLLPRGVGDDAAALYAWCRRADDTVDVPGPRLARAGVAELRGELDRVYGEWALVELERDGGPALAAFAEVVRRRGVPRAYPDAMLDGMAADADGERPERWFDLLAYCYRVASTVGLMMCHVMELRDASARRHAAHLGIAMQLTNVCRDVEEDWRMGRCYLPAELLRAHGAAGLAAIAPGSRPLTDADRAPLAACVREVLAVADRYYRSGDRGLRALPWRAALGVRTARRVYAAIGRELARRDHDVLGGRAIVSTPRKLLLAARALGAALVALPHRLFHPFRAVPMQRALVFPDDVLPV